MSTDSPVVLPSRALSSLQRSEAQLEVAQEGTLTAYRLMQAIIDRSPAAISVRDLEGRYLFVNDRRAALSGCAPEEIIGSTDSERGAPKDAADAALETDRAAVAFGVTEVEETRVLEDGAVHTFLSQKFPLVDALGAPYAVCGISLDITARRHSEDEVIRLNRELEGCVLERTAQLEATNKELESFSEALRTSDEHRRRLIVHLVAAQERERAKIANDIHDDSLQAITASVTRLEMVRDDTEDPVKKAALAKAVDTVRMAAGRLRHLLFDVRPPALDRVGLAAALREQLVRLALETDVKFDLRSDLLCEPSIPVRVTLFRIAQEALVNVRKHSVAAHALVTICAKDGGTLLTVTDDGVGLPEASDVGDGGLHYGIGSMTERAEQVGGWCHVANADGAGTTVEAWVPDVLDGDAA